MPLKKYNLPDQAMVTNAEAVLRILGQPPLPIVDIFTRESIQNSLDAALPNSLSELKVSFAYYQNPDNNFIEKLRDLISDGEDDTQWKRLSQRVNNQGGEKGILLIRDSGTNGLSGPVRRDEDGFSWGGDRKNFYNLVYGIGRNHGSEYAGGSYGLGKTIYYQLSAAGLVLFYSRFKKSDNEFQERLAFCMVSNAEQNEGNNLGICWWGDLYALDGFNHPCPITDSDEIGKLLGSLGLTNARYTDEETGTAIGIICPDFQKFQLPVDEDNVLNQDNFQSNIIQSALRWYWPRMIETDEVNNNGNKKPLQLYLGAEKVNYDKYAVLKDLLGAAEKNNSNQNDFPKNIKTTKIISNNGNTWLGTLAYKETGNVNQNLPLANKIYMLRAPRMVVFEKELNLPKHTIYALFLLKSDNMVQPRAGAAGDELLDNVIKQSEGPTHCEWEENSQYYTDKTWCKTYVRRIKKVNEDIEKIFQDREPPKETTGYFRHAALIGNILMGDAPGVTRIPHLGGGARGNGRAAMTIETEIKEYLNEDNLQKVVVQIKVKNCRADHSVKIFIKAKGSSGSLKKGEWIAKVGRDFPFEIENVAFTDNGMGNVIGKNDDEQSISFTPQNDVIKINLTLVIKQKDTLISFSKPEVMEVAAV